MQAAVVNVLGQPPRYQPFPDPIPAEGEVAILVRAAGLHPIVKAIAAGAHYSATAQVPVVPGLDGVGILDDGARVYFAFVRKPWGTMAQRAAAPRAMCIPLPDNLGDAEAAAIANPGMSAWLSLKNRAALSAGESVLVLGATGVAGRLALQIARHLGAGRLVAAGRNLQAIPPSAADALVSLAQPDDAVRDAFAAEAAAGIDVVIDYLWGHPTELLLQALARGFRPGSTPSTRLVQVGESAGSSIHLPAAILRSIDLKLMGSGFGSVPLQSVLDAIPTLFALAAQGALRIAAEPVPLAEVESVWDRADSGRRIVFTP